MKFFSPKYLLALKKGEVADFRNVQKSELCHYQYPRHYKTSVGYNNRPLTNADKKHIDKGVKELRAYRKANGIPERKLPLGLRIDLWLHRHNNYQKVTPFEEKIKYCQSMSKSGLYPPEIILLDEIKNNSQKYPLSDGEYYSDSWWFNFGIVDVLSHIKKLEKAGLIELKDKKYAITKKGESELVSSGEVLWVNNLKAKASDHGNIWDVTYYINKDLPEKYSDKPWEFKVLYRYKRIIADAINRKDINSAKTLMGGMARFYSYIGDNQKCLETYKDILVLKQQYKEYDENFLLAPNEDEFLKKKIAEYQERLK